MSEGMQVTPTVEELKAALEAEKAKTATAREESIVERHKRQELEKERAALEANPYVQGAVEAYNAGLDPTRLAELVQQEAAARTEKEREKATQQLKAEGQGDPEARAEIERLRNQLDNVTYNQVQQQEIAAVQKFCNEYAIAPAGPEGKAIRDHLKAIGFNKPLTYDVLEGIAKFRGMKKANERDPEGEGLEAVTQDESGEYVPPMERGRSAPPEGVMEDPLKDLPSPGDPAFRKKLLERGFQNFRAKGGQRGR